MNPEDLKRLHMYGKKDYEYDVRSENSWDDGFSTESIIEALTRSEPTQKESVKKSIGKKTSNKGKSKIEHSWKTRERKYKAWVVKDGVGKIVESKSFYFLSKFFEHIEEEYDFYELMDGVCIDPEKDNWLYEGDIVEIQGGESHLGYREYNVNGVVDCRGTSYYVVDNKNVLHPLDHVLYTDDPCITLIGNIYEK